MKELFKNLDPTLDYHIKTLRQQISDVYLQGNFDLVIHNSIIMNINSIEELIKELYIE